MMTQNSGTVSDSFYLAALIESYSYSSSLVWEQYELRARANRAQECMLQQTGGKNRFFLFQHSRTSIGWYRSVSGHLWSLSY